MPADRYVHGHVGRQNMPLDICAWNNVQIQIGLLNINNNNNNNNNDNNNININNNDNNKIRQYTCFK